MTTILLPDLSTSEGKQVAQDMLLEAGWGRCDITIKGMLDICPDGLLHELSCLYAEDVLDKFEAEFPDDTRPREAIEAKRKWARGEISNYDLHSFKVAARLAATENNWVKNKSAWPAYWATNISLQSAYWVAKSVSGTSEGSIEQLAITVKAMLEYKLNN
jgi:hypothetical protein